MSVYDKFLGVWYREIRALNIYPMANMCVFSHMATDHACGSPSCWSQLLFYLRFAPSWFRIIPKDIINLLQAYLLQEPPAQSMLRVIQTGIAQDSCPDKYASNLTCGHNARLPGCRICFPDGGIKPSREDLIRCLPLLRPTVDLIPRLISYMSNEFNVDMIEILADFILRHGLPHMALNLEWDSSSLMIAILRERNHFSPDPHIQLLIDIM